MSMGHWYGETKQSIADVIGLEATEKLMAHYGGFQLYVPSPYTRDNGAKRRFIEIPKRLLDGPLSARQIANQLGCSRETVLRRRGKKRYD